MWSSKKNKEGVKPWLLEVNHAPSLNIDTPTDRDTKFKLLCDTFRILQLRNYNPKKLSEEEKSMQQERLLSRTSKMSRQEELERRKKARQLFMEREAKRALKTGFTKIYPTSDTSKYDKFIVHEHFCPETVASQARKEAIQRQQEEKDRKEQEELRLRQRRKVRHIDPNTDQLDVVVCYHPQTIWLIHNQIRMNKLKQALHQDARTENSVERCREDKEPVAQITVEDIQEQGRYLYTVRHNTCAIRSGAY